jgi:formylglycine-generating enzyme required for sulfatase activity
VTDLPDDMVDVPGGDYRLGAAGGHEPDSPPRTVRLAPFLLDRHEVTNRQPPVR